MNFIFTTLLSYILLYKYLAIFVVTFFGALLLPLPSGTLLVASGAFASQGFFNIFYILISGIAGNIAGDNTGYWLARKYGAEVLARAGFRRLLNSPNFKSIEDQTQKSPLVFIYLSRFMTGIAPTVNIIAGLSKMKYRRYLLFESLGEVTEVFFFTSIGYIFGTQWERASGILNNSGILIIIGAIGTFFLWKYVGKKINK